MHSLKSPHPADFGLAGPDATPSPAAEDRSVGPAAAAATRALPATGPGRLPQRVELTYALGTDRSAGPVHHPLFALLDALHRGGSVSSAAASLGLSYRHVWGELRRWELQLDRSLVVWSKGQRATLT